MTTPCITSRQNPRVKDAVRLRTRRGRQRQGRFVIDGAREIARAVAAGIRPVEAFVCEGRRDGELVESLWRAGAEIFPVTAEVYEKLRFGERDEVGVVVVAETPERGLDDLQLPAEPLVAVVEGVEKPGNLGAILRSADAAGVDAVIVADGATDLFNPNTIRTSLGTVFRAKCGGGDDGGDDRVAAGAWAGGGWVADRGGPAGRGVAIYGSRFLRRRGGGAGERGGGAERGMAGGQRCAGAIADAWRGRQSQCFDHRGGVVL